MQALEVGNNIDDLDKSSRTARDNGIDFKYVVKSKCKHPTYKARYQRRKGKEKSSRNISFDCGDYPTQVLAAIAVAVCRKALRDESIETYQDILARFGGNEAAAKDFAKDFANKIMKKTNKAINDVQADETSKSVSPVVQATLAPGAAGADLTEDRATATTTPSPSHCTALVPACVPLPALANAAAILQVLPGGDDAVARMDQPLQMVERLSEHGEPEALDDGYAEAPVDAETEPEAMVDETSAIASYSVSHVVQATLAPPRAAALITTLATAPAAAAASSPPSHAGVHSDLVRFMTELGYSECISKLQTEGVITLDDLMKLTEDDLKDPRLGLTLMARRNIWDQLETLRQAACSSSSEAPMLSTAAGPPSKYVAYYSPTDEDIGQTDECSIIQEIVDEANRACPGSVQLNALRSMKEAISYRKTLPPDADLLMHVASHTTAGGRIQADSGTNGEQVITQLIAHVGTPSTQWLLTLCNSTQELAHLFTEGTFKSILSFKIPLFNHDAIMVTKYYYKYAITDGWFKDVALASRVMLCGELHRLKLTQLMNDRTGQPCRCKSTCRCKESPSKNFIEAVCAHPYRPGFDDSPRSVDLNARSGMLLGKRSRAGSDTSSVSGDSD